MQSNISQKEYRCINKTFYQWKRGLYIYIYIYIYLLHNQKASMNKIMIKKLNRAMIILELGKN